YGSLIVVFLTMSVLTALRWPHDVGLALLGGCSLGTAAFARRSIGRRGPWRFRAHVIGMGASYVLLLIAFYVDNGRSLPLWRSLPPVLYWLLPVLIGAPLVFRATLWNELTRRERERSAMGSPR